MIEDELAAALTGGEIAGAGIDVFSTEPATKNVLFGVPNIVCTPHLGASTGEAQENVAIQIAEQMSDYLIDGAVANALNMPSITAEEAPRLTPFVTLADQLGSFAGQLTETGAKGREVAMCANKSKSRCPFRAKCQQFNARLCERSALLKAALASEMGAEIPHWIETKPGRLGKPASGLEV